MSTRKKWMSWGADIQKIPPARTMVYLFMAGSALLFVTLLFAHAVLIGFRLFDGQYSRLPRAFVLSTLVLSAGTLLLRNLKPLFSGGRLPLLVQRLTLACSAGLLFAVLQVWGWFGLYRLNQTEPFLSREWTLIGLVSALHLLHLIGAFALLVYQTAYFYRKMKDPAGEVIVLADPYYYERIRTLAIFWFYTDFIWVFIFLYFLAAL